MAKFKIMWRLYIDEEVDGEQWDPGYVGTLDECYNRALARGANNMRAYKEKLYFDKDEIILCMEPHKVLPTMDMAIAAKWIREIVQWDVTPTTERDEIEELLDEYEKLANSRDFTLNRVKAAQIVYAYWRELQQSAAQEN